MAADSYIHVTFTKGGRIKEVRRGGKVAKRRKPKPGAPLKPGAKSTVVGLVRL